MLADVPSLDSIPITTRSSFDITVVAGSTCISTVLCVTAAAASTDEEETAVVGDAEALAICTLTLSCITYMVSFTANNGAETSAGKA